MTKLITQEGLNKIKKELEERKTKIRQEIAAAIKEAKEQGDLSENAEYSEAKRQQGENESRINQLESMIKNSQVVYKSDSNERVEIGSSVKVKFNGSELSFTIVGSNESNPQERKISNESPIGKALLGKRVKDRVAIKTPSGEVVYTILEIK